MANRIVTKSHRKALKVRRDPYFEKVQAGLSLGFRKIGTDSGNWIARIYDQGRYQYQPLGSVDEFTYEDARSLTLKWSNQVKNPLDLTNPTSAALSKAKLKVDHVLDNYLAHKLAEDGKEAVDGPSATFDKHVRPFFGNRAVASLTRHELQTWLNGLVIEADPKNGIKGRKKDTARRIFTPFKAALNRAYDHEIVEKDFWSAVGLSADEKEAVEVDNMRSYVFNKTQLTNLIDVAPDWFKPFLILGRYTGGRNGELRNVKRAHFHADTGKLYLNGKTGPRYATVGREGVADIAAICSTRKNNELVYQSAIGTPSNKKTEERGFKASVEAYNESGFGDTIPKGVTFYNLRHSYVTHALNAGLQIKLVADNCGTSEKMIREHYSHLIKEATSDLMDTIDL